MPSLRINRQLPVAFYEMDDKGFEEMTVALLDKEPGIASADLYRRQRQRQYGIDVLARRNDGLQEVASCKCYKVLKKGDLAQWSDDFLEHWDTHWKSENIQRFVLVVAADVHSAERDAEVRAERCRFEQHGITYEVWAPRQLQERLRPHSGIVSQYLGPEHVERICGTTPVAIPATSGSGFVLDGTAAAYIGELKAFMSRSMAEKLDRLVAQLRAGVVADTVQTLNNIEKSPEWDALDDEIKARFLRVKASVQIHFDDDDGAWRLAAAADALDSRAEPRLRAILTYRREGTTAALDVLGRPHSQEGAHLRVSLLLDHGEIEAARSVLDGHPAIETGHPETLRLRAYLAVTMGDRSAGLRHAEAALAAAPDLPATMRVAAVARYASALSPAVDLDHAIQPNPVAIDLVREDAASRNHLIRALETFDALARKELPVPERRDAEVFALACLCNLRDRTSDAAARLDAMLAADPGWVGPACWALARGLPFNQDAFEAELRRRLQDGEADAECVLMLANLAAADGRMSEAIALLEASSAFKTSDAVAHRDTWLANLRRRALPPGQETAPEQLGIGDLPGVIEDASRSGDWSRAEAWLGRLAAREGCADPLLLPLSQALAASSRWNALSRHVDALLSLATPEPIRVAAYAAIRSGNSFLALDILSRHRDSFAGGRLPSDLARLEVEALAANGDQRTAVRNAVLLAKAEGSTVDDQLTAALAHLRAGDTRAAVPFAEAARRSGMLPPLHALQLAHHLSSVDRSVASSLLRHAMSGELNPKLKPAALSAALKLGLDQLTRPLLADIHALSEQPGSGVMAVTIEGLEEAMREHREAGERIARLHLSGAVPVHMAAERSGANLAQIYSLDERERGDYPLLMLNGNRSGWDQAAVTTGAGPVHVDTTSLLLADQLGLMEVLEGLAGMVVLPPSLPGALLDLESGLRPVQPDRSAAKRGVLAMIASGRLTLEAGGTASDDGQSQGGSSVGWLLDFDAGTGGLTAHELPEAMCRLNMRGMVEALLSFGGMDPERGLEALDQLGIEGTRAAVGAPSRQDAVRVTAGTAVELARAGVLDDAATAFRLAIALPYHDAIKAEIKEEDRRQTVADRLAELRTRVATNLVQGTFRTLPGADLGTAENSAPTTRCLFELVRDPGVSGGITWVDDRHVTAHGMCGENRIMGTPDMLEALASAGRITPAQRWTALGRLRRNNALFLPLRAAEVTHHLRIAPIRDGQVVETPALATLRRYMSRAFRAAEHLDVGPVRQGTGQGEMPFLLSLRRIAEETLLEIWTSDRGDDRDRERWSNWVWLALRIDRFPDLGLPGTAPSAWRKLLIFNHAALLANGLHVLLQTDPSVRLDRLKAYMAWVASTAVPSWVESDDEFAKDVAGHFSELLLRLATNTGSDLDRDQKAAGRFRAILGGTFTAVPEPFNAHLVTNQALCRAGGVTRSETIELGDRKFKPAQLWKACQEALATGKAKVKTADGTGTLHLRLRTGAVKALLLSGALEGVLADPVLGLLERPRDARVKATRHLVEGFGLGRADAAAATTSLAAIKNLPDRIDAAVAMRAGSVTIRRRQLQERLHSRENVAWSEFSPPDPKSLLRYVGLVPDAEAPMRQRLEDAAQALIGNFGVAEAVRRLASLPIPLPPDVLTAVQALPEADRTSLTDELGGAAATPLQILHYVRVLRHQREAGLDVSASWEASLRSFPARWTGSADLMTTLLRQFGEELHPAGWLARGLSADEALLASWMHADHVTGAILGAGYEGEAAAQKVRGRPLRREAGCALVLRLDYDGAAANTSSMLPDVLVFHGLGYALGSSDPEGSCRPATDVLDGLRSLMAKKVDGRWAPAPWLLADRDGAPDALGSWFSGRPAWLLPTPDLKADAARATVGSALGDLCRPVPNKVQLWGLLGVLARPHLDAERKALAATAVCGADLRSLVDSDSEMGIHVLRAAAELAQVCGDLAARTSFEDALVSYAEQMADAKAVQPTRAHSGEAVASALIEAAAAVSRSGTEAEGWGRFGPLVVRLARAWPDVVPHIRSIVGALATAAHPANSASLWASWLALREMP